LKTKALEIKFENDEKSFFDELRKEIKPESNVKAWFKNTWISTDEDGSPVLCAPTTFSRQQIEKRFSKQLSNVAEHLWQQPVKVCVKSKKTTEMPQEDFVKQETKSFSNYFKTEIERFEGFAFNDYEAGVENQLPFFAAKNIFSQDCYNSPFTLVGDHGTGKTHLASAIVNGMEKSSIAFMHAEEFANSFISNVVSGNLESFRNSLRSKKVLIIEDLDFILDGNKKKTIEEIIQTIKILKRDKKVIILTSTAPLNDYESVSPKLVNILLSGLKVKLSGPSEQTRKIIISNYLSDNKVKLSAKCIQFVESIEFNNHRELLGALKQLSTFAKFDKNALSLKVIRDILGDHLSNSLLQNQSSGELDLHHIAKNIATRYGISVQKMMSSSRERHISNARHLAMTISYENHNTLNEIGQFYGGRSHTSVLYSLDKISQKRKSDSDFNKLYLKISREIKK
jgi:chromosomal replication initiator protein